MRARPLAAAARAVCRACSRPISCARRQHHEKHQAVFFNWSYLFLSLFVVINTMISVWEIALHVYSRCAPGRGGGARGWL